MRDEEDGIDEEEQQLIAAGGQEDWAKVSKYAEEVEDNSKDQFEEGRIG